MGEPQVRVLEEGELELVVLADAHERPRGVEPVCEEEKREEVYKSVWEAFVLREGLPDLRGVRTLGNGAITARTCFQPMVK